jgi:hypothetical protein
MMPQHSKIRRFMFGKLAHLKKYEKWFIEQEKFNAQPLNNEKRFIRLQK